MLLIHRQAAPAHALKLLWLIQCVAMGAMEMSGPFWALHLQTGGRLSASELSWYSAIAYAGPMLTAMLCIPWWGKAGDRIGHHWMLLRALAALALTQLWLAYCTQPLWIILIRLLQGAIAGFIAAAQAYGSQLSHREQRGQLMASLQTATALGSVLGPMAGGWLYQSQGFAAVNLLAAGLCTGCLLLAALYLPRSKVVPANARTSMPSSPGSAQQTAWWRQGMLPGFLIGILLVQSAKMLPQAYFSLYVTQVMQANTGFAGLSYGLSAAGLCLCAPLWASYFRHQQDSSILRWMIALCIASAVLMAVQSLYLSANVFLICRFLWGCVLGALLPVFYSLLSLHTPANSQGQALAYGNSAAKAGALLGTAAGALLMAILPLQHLFWAVAVAYFITALLLTLIPHTYPSPGSAPA
ncbi:MFS transporter [Undibacterium rugosum]|uniref:MFS transporter n=1 Tax=Undibacterium rugosum TaxID=2762291 RepID=A0A923I135_9BURK|nr:MFS transporter [Undibacterium rugosum]MBC3934542.1 MFS transporter [Undibacterium rugosum]MBR7777157.1 MFS transporter [Undibacterium rugosum]